MTQPLKKQIDEAPANAMVQALLKQLGYGALGFALLVPVYQDYKALNKDLLEQVKASTQAASATAAAMTGLASQIAEGHSRIDEMRSTVDSISENVRIIAAKRGTE